MPRAAHRTSLWGVQRRKWSDLTRTQQRGVIGLGAVKLVLTAYALMDLARRPGSHVRGPKLLWLAALPVQPLGPIAYLTLGRRT